MLFLYLFCYLIQGDMMHIIIACYLHWALTPCRRRMCTLNEFTGCSCQRWLAFLWDESSCPFQTQVLWTQMEQLAQCVLRWRIENHLSDQELVREPFPEFWVNSRCIAHYSLSSPQIRQFCFIQSQLQRRTIWSLAERDVQSLSMSSLSQHATLRYRLHSGNLQTQ